MPTRIQRKSPPRTLPVRLTITAILSWADAYHARNGRWPNRFSGEVRECRWTTWRQIDRALQDGFRGLRGGSSVAKLLAKHRGIRNIGDLPELTEAQILAWADAHFARTGEWPRERGGPIVGAPGETWRNVGASLREGDRGLPTGGSLPKLLEEHRLRRNQGNLPRLTVKRILQWADAHHRRTCSWPTTLSGEIVGSGGENWRTIDNALHRGARGLKRDSLAELLARKRGYRNKRNLPRLTMRQILMWADAYHAKHGCRPTKASGPIGDTGETWEYVDEAMRKGFRGLPDGSSLFRLLRRRFRQ